MIRRFSSKFLRISKTISTRRDHGISSSVIVQLEEPFALNSYKQESLHQFRRVLKISEPAINPKSGVHFVNNRTLEESSVWSPHALYRHEPAPRFFKKLDAEVNVLPDNQFFHFLIEDLPRFIEVYSQVPHATVVIPHKKRYLVSSLDVLNVNDFQVIGFPFKPLASYISEKELGGIFKSSDLVTLKNFGMPFVSGSTTKKLFISRSFKKERAQDVGRGLDSSKLVESIHREAGFEVTNLEHLTLPEQISLISSAHTISGFHGAGLANLVWMQRGANVIELTESRITLHFEHLSKIANLNYSRVLLDPAEIDKKSLRKILAGL